ncbi:MAG: hypothetical protein NTZ58_06765 [Solirubrobacterales bacterium]|nr:hypothetical protein [Solirubrobacterales bacterium]
MAVVVVGVMAGTSPAMASQWSHQHADNKQFGEAIHKLRISNDLTNYSVGQITAASIVALTALKDGLTKVADATTEFKYGVVQVALNTGAAGDGIAGMGPAQFWVTPPIVKTGASSTVTFPIGLTGGAVRQVKLFTAVRSVYPDKGDVVCRVTVQNGSSGLSVTANGDPALKGFYQPMPQSRIQPENGNKTYPLNLVALEDNVINLADASKVDAVPTAAAGTSGIGTLTCLRTS